MSDRDRTSTASFGSEVVELIFLLPSHQFSALEEAANRLEVPVAQLLRRTLLDFLRQPGIGGG
jgi:hypothetical protein